MHQRLQRWLWYGSMGTLTIGFGASLLGEATSLKYAKQPIWQWVLLGSLAISCLNGGIILLLEAVKQRTLYELETQD